MAQRQTDTSRAHTSLALDSSLALIVLAATAYLWGNSYYDGFFSYFGIKVYLLDISTERLLTASWPWLPVMFFLALVCWVPRWTQLPLGYRRIIRSLPLWLVAAWALSIVANAWTLPSAPGWPLGLGLAWAVLAFLVATSVLTGKLVPRTCRFIRRLIGHLRGGPRLGLYLFLIAFPSIMFAYEAGWVYAKRSIVVGERKNRIVELTPSNLLLPERANAPLLLILHDAGWIHVAEGYREPSMVPSRPRVHVLRESDVERYVTYEASESE